jgi:hypothetical protein
VKKFWGGRGQVLTSEFIAAVFIFMIVLVFAVFLWTTVWADIARAEFLHDFEAAADDAVEKLVRTEGYPVDWETRALDNISSVGLCSESRVLQEAKVGRFLELMDSGEYDDLCDDASISNYNCSRSLLGLQGYEFYFTLSDMDDNILVLGGRNASTGNFPAEYEYMVSAPRSAVFNGSIVKANLVVWV